VTTDYLSEYSVTKNVNKVVKITARETTIPQITITNYRGVTAEYVYQFTEKTARLNDQSKKNLDKALKLKENKFEIWMNHDECCNYLSRIPSSFENFSIVSSETLTNVLNNNRVEDCPSQKVLKNRNSFENEASASLTRRNSLWVLLINFVTFRQTNITVGNVNQTLLYSDEVSNHSIKNKQSTSWKKIFKRKKEINM